MTIVVTELTAQLFKSLKLNTTSHRLVNREKLLLHYPNAVAQTIYSSYCHAFPVSWRRYDTEFKLVKLLNILFSNNLLLPRPSTK